MKAQSVTCRRATLDDVTAVAELFHLCDRHYWGDKAAAREDIAGHLRQRVLTADADAKIILAEAGSRAVGFACFALLYPARDCGGKLYRKEPFVRAAARGGGLDLPRMRAVARHGLARGAVRLDWTAETTNPRAVAFYEHIGARRLAEKLYFRFDGDSLKDFAGGS